MENDEELTELSEKEEEFAENQEKSYLAYCDIMAEFAGTTDKEPEINQYPDYYGGAYIDDEGLLVIKITQPLDDCSEMIKELANQERIICETAKIPYKASAIGAHIF